MLGVGGAGGWGLSEVEIGIFKVINLRKRAR